MGFGVIKRLFVLAHGLTCLCLSRHFISTVNEHISWLSGKSCGPRKRRDRPRCLPGKYLVFDFEPSY